MSGDQLGEREHWHLKKELTWGHLLSTVMLLVMMIGVYTDNQAEKQTLSERIRVLEVQQIEQKQMIDVRLQSMQSSLDEIRRGMEKLIDRQLARGR